ncbi:cadherin domain-containing protein [bacterium endosymbiont of Bathymodiolus sp. 5 South]|uniref:cadherin domain-containing protein n=1 Tax=bacterium endosymbiont of Bathymodiolus sp. 5 South TaxID=1181670 RepID=UPI00111A209A|nr:cadherin domain-containing protein [bacterium endosymbiont of Bathymodiolus sp. 5 South]
MKTIKLFIISVLLLSSFQALAALITERMNAVENKDQVFRLHSIKTISYAESSDREQFIISKTGITLKKQNYEALDNKTLYIKVDIVLTDGVPLRLYVIFTVLDVAEAPKNIQLSNSTIEAGSVNGTVIGTATAADDDTNNADLSYSLDDDTSNEYFSITSKGELSIKTKVNKKPGGNYLVKINASDPQNNSASKMFEITVTKATPKFAITTADVSTLEKVAKVINLTANKDNVSFVIGGGADRDKFSLPKGSNKLTFAATDFKAGGDNTYSVVIIASKTGEDHISKTITVTVLDGRLHITTADAFFTPENVDKVITLTANKTVAAFTILGGDEDKFSINGTKLTFKATDFKARKNATYRVSIIATRVIMVNGHRVPETAVKELTVTVLKGVSFQITTADAFSTPENNPNMVISLTTNKDANKNVDVNFSITGGADQGKFTLSGNTLTFEATDFEARTDHTYSVETTASRRIGTENEVVTKTITVTVTDLNDVAPTNIQISNTTLVGNLPAGTLVGTLSVTDADTAADALIFTTTDPDAPFFQPSPNPDFEIVNRNQLKTKRRIVTIGNMAVPIGVSDGVHYTREDFTIKVIEALEDEGELVITTTDVATPENADKVIVLTVNRSDVSNVSFAITGGADKAKFSLSGNTLTFAATDFEARSDHAYSVIITASEADKSSVSKTITVTVTDLNDVAPTNIQISNTNLLKGQPAGTVVGTLSATDIDTAADALIFTITNNADFEIVNRNQLKTKRLIDTIGDMTITVTVNDGIQSANQEFSIKVTEETKKLVITTANVSTPENVAKVIKLTASQRGVNFSITGGRNQAKFSLSGKTLTFKATSFKDPGDNTYQVNIKATKGNDTTEKILTVTVEASTRTGVGASRVLAVRMAAQAVRKESKTASKALLFKVGKTLMGRLSHIRHKDKQKSRSSANGFVSGIQVSFADSQTNSLINHVLSANGLNNVIPTSSRKIERWDTWTSAKVVIGKSNGTGANKTKFNLKSLNMGMDRHIAKDKIIGFALSLGKQDRTATGNDFSGDVDTTQYTLSSYGALELNDKGSIEAVLSVAKATHNISNSADQDNSNGFFASIAYRADLQAQGVDLSPFIRYDISRIKMKANDILTSSETNTNEAIALGIEINKQVNYRGGQLNRFVSVEYKSDIRRDTSDYLSKNAEQEVSVKLGLDYQKDNTSASVSYERIQSTNNKAHSDGIEGVIQWKF